MGVVESAAVAPAVLAARLVLGVLFVVAGASKLRDGDRFRRAVETYAVLPPRMARVVARVVPPVECLAGALLVVGLLPSVAAAAVALLLVAFTAAITVNLLRGRRIDCGCFDAPGGQPISWTTVGRNGLLLALALGLVWAGPVGPGISPAPANVAAPDVVAVVIVIVSLFATARLGAAAFVLARAVAAPPADGGPVVGQIGGGS